MAASGLVKGLVGLTRISGLLVGGLIMLARRFSVDFATDQPLRS